MNLVGERVLHKRFGTGTIVKYDEGGIDVLFDSSNERMQFSASVELNICNYLTFINPKAEALVKQLYEMAEEQKRIESEGRRINDFIQRNAKIPQFATVEDFCNTFESELMSEIQHLQKSKGNRYQITDGELIATNAEQYIYVFEMDSDVSLVDGTEITLYNSQQEFYASIISCHDYTITLSTGSNIGNKIQEMEFSVESWKLLETLINHLTSILKNPSDIVTQLVCNCKTALEMEGTIATSAKTAIKTASSQPITFIWGPPGTGKTEALAEIVLKHIRNGKRVLMLAHSNVSVDGAILRIYKKASNLSPGVIVRYGYPRDGELLSHEYLTSFNLALRNHPELKNERDSLLDQLKLLPKNSDRRPFISKHLTRIRNLLGEEEKEIAKSSRFVATTVSKATIDDTIYDQKFDVVIFDEASMAYIPQVVFAASLAKNHFISIGDFYQLPPIVQNDEGSRLNADIFDYCYVSMAVERGLKHKWMCLLDTQYRMHSNIANFASDYMYRGLIKTANGVDEGRDSIVASEPKSGLALGLVDTAGYMSVCTTASNGSRVNVLSAFISCFLALKAAEKFEVGIISPYNAQSRLIRAITRDIAQNNNLLHLITSSTVHQFQGSEKDVIIFDAVDCHRMRYPGILLTAQENNSANRLFNVAMTRAKGKFLAVANVAYMKNGLSNSLNFKKFISDLNESPRHIKGEDIFAETSLANESCLKLYQNRQSDSDFLNDIANAEKEIRIDIPGKTCASNAFIETLCSMLNEAESRGVKIFIRAENVCELPEKLKKISSENKYVYDPISLIDKKIVWFGMPASVANFIINNREQQTRYRPIFRMCGNYTPKTICSLLQLNQNDNPTSKTNNYSESDNLATYIYRNVKCSTCHNPMKLSKNKSGVFYLSCSSKSKCKTEYVTAELVNNYLKIHKKDTIKCSVDGTSLKAFLGKRGVYIQCSGPERHFFSLDEV